MNRYFDFNETQVIGRCERVMIRHDIVGVRKEKVILIVTGPFPFGLITRYTQEMSAFGLLRQPQGSILSSEARIICTHPNPGY